MKRATKRHLRFVHVLEHILLALSMHSGKPQIVKSDAGFRSRMGEETFLKRIRFRRADFQSMVIAMGFNGQVVLCGHSRQKQIC
jgi:hypothetical protein